MYDYFPQIIGLIIFITLSLVSLIRLLILLKEEYNIMKQCKLTLDFISLLFVIITMASVITIMIIYFLELLNVINTKFFEFM